MLKICQMGVWKLFEDFPEKEDELDIYTEEGIEEYVDDDSISPTEQGFMQGYLGA